MDNKDLIAAITSTKRVVEETDKSALEFVLGENAGFQNVLDKEKEAAGKEAEKNRKAKEKQEKLDADKKLKDSLSPNQFLMTDMTDGRLPSSGINHVMFRYPKGTWTEDQEVDIPEVDPFFLWDAEVLEAVWLAYTINATCLAAGPPGTGKTTVFRQLAAWLCQPFARFNGKDGIDPASFLGYAWATKEGMEWKDGLMPQAVRDGYLTDIDEVFKLPPGIQMAMQSLYEQGGFLMLDEKPGTIQDKHIHPRKEFRLFGTDNTKGTGDGMDLYAAGQQQDISTLDRFLITVEVGYLTKSVETGMLEKKHPTVEPSAIKKIVSMANLVRNAFITKGDLSLTLSPRGLSVVCNLLEKNIGIEKALHLAYVNKLGDDIETRIAKGFIKDAI